MKPIILYASIEKGKRKFTTLIKIIKKKSDLKLECVGTSQQSQPFNLEYEARKSELRPF